MGWDVMGWDGMRVGWDGVLELAPHTYDKTCLHR